MYDQHHLSNRAGPKFTTGAGPWPSGSDSDTERDYHRSQSRSGRPPNRNGYRDNAEPDDYRASASVETSIDTAPPISYWSAKRHSTCGNPTPLPPWSTEPISWRHTSSLPGKLKTANAALVLCLNIDVDPPDVVKTTPCAVLECWVDPRSMPSHKALEAIGANLKHQFEGLSLKIQYKPILDPSFEDLRKACQQLRKQAKDDAVLFHYNGHGVPKPTSSGELWCFNRNYTQYIPVSLQEVQNWLGSPGVYIWDCSAAGHLLSNFNAFAQKRDEELIRMNGKFPEGMLPFSQSLQLAACAANEILPTCPDLPADMFTSCLTSPIDIAIRHYMINNPDIPLDATTHIPGDLKDRRTPLGELNWIFTAITDTIAWTTFSPEIFARLYRSDLLIASLFRNFLLAERLMKGYNCTPHTSPPLPPTNTHLLWATWDLALDACVKQLPQILAETQHSQYDGPKPTPYVYVPSRFFADQLTAFEVWISRGGSALTRRGPLSLPSGDRSSTTGDTINGHTDIWDNVKEHHLVPRKPPDQLPIVLQVLLSQPHRLRALILLSQFVDLGPWAVNLVLTIGIFPYISKLLQAPGPDLRPVLIFIWARILAVDPSVQQDLFTNAQGYRYFSNILAMKADHAHVLPNSSEHQAMCSFILSALARDFPRGQQACWEEHVFVSCYDRLEEPDFLLRQWTALCIGQMWDGYDQGKMAGVDRGTQDKLTSLLSDDSAEVRCAALFALGTFMGASGSADPNKRGGGGSGAMYDRDERTHFKMEVAVVTGATLVVKDDASPMCRKELLILISCLVKEWRGYFVVCAWLYWEEERIRRGGGHTFSLEDISNQAVAEWLESFGDDHMLRVESRVLLSSFYTIFVVLLDLSVDPYHEVATNAQTIVDYIMALLLDSAFTRLENSSLNAPPAAPPIYKSVPNHNAFPRSRRSSLQSSPLLPPASPSGSLRPSLSRADTMTSSITSSVSNTMKRTSSFANTLKNLAGNIAFPTMDESHHRTSPTSSLYNYQQSKAPEASNVSRPPSPVLNVAQYSSPYLHPLTPQTDSFSTYQQASADFYPSDVMLALMEEDMERLRLRRKPRRSHSYHHQNSTPSPSNSTFSVDSSSSVILGMGTGLGIRDVLPLKSTFFDWCCEYFTEPQMRQTEADEPGSIQYDYQVWRQQRNEQVESEVRTQVDIASQRTWDRSVATLQGIANPLTLTFHSYDQHLVVANETDVVTVWDWAHRRRLRSFCNGNPRGTSITSVEIINQDVGGIITIGSADGVVRLYRNYDPALDPGPVQMVSAFRGLNELVPMQRGAGLVMDWKQSSGILLVGGDSRVIKAWDAQTEIQHLDLETNSDCPVTSIVSDPGSTQTFVAGFGDGVVKVFDRRKEENDSVIQTFYEHAAWIQNVRPHPTIPYQYLTASLDGEVRLWDTRNPQRSVQTWEFMPSGLSAFDVHNSAEVFAGTSALTSTSWKSQRLFVRSLLTDRSLTKINLSTGYTIPPVRPGHLSSFIPRGTSFAFHPTEMLFGVGEPDGTIRITGCKMT
ncbi:hypothetical protein D9758_007263 [Tetrapyrgos nigripes]|uniref:Raptor N-terminal CASPase-like domain-containing protein n=1 Tax=Tetrapyrgos nigripes TaxID=182062 RepID=A0A8H5D2L5_9AGAR|nr:hypothetical protein D9758_007263 [Tetrapyrgos nigripes]